jgi:hypothetical protein
MNEMNLSGRVTSLFPRFELPRFEPDSLPAENLYRCCGLYQLERERVLLDYPKVGEEVGIWDILGNYDPVKGEVLLHELCIEDHARRLAVVLDEMLKIFALRELVRLHEHVHALIHTCPFARELREPNIDYSKLPSAVEEPVTEFVAWSIIKKYPHAIFADIFREVDAATPAYYQRWRLIEELFKEKTKIDSCLLVPGLVVFTRKARWKDFNDFFTKLEEKGVSFSLAYSLKTT